MMYRVRFQFPYGAFTYRPGEEFTAEQLAERGMDSAALGRHHDYGFLQTPSEVRAEEAEAGLQVQLEAAQPQPDPAAQVLGDPAQDA